jgi:hypothetical protein
MNKKQWVEAVLFSIGVGIALYHQPFIKASIVAFSAGVVNGLFIVPMLRDDDDSK